MTAARTLAPVVALGLLSPGWAGAAEPESAVIGGAVVEGAVAYPRIVGEVLIEVQDDLRYHSQDDDAELNDLFATIEPAIALELTEGFSIRGAGVLEPVEEPAPRQNREFDRHGLFLEELFAELAGDAWSLRAGKFNPRFGRAWDLAPGLYGVDFAEDYELTERVGVGGTLEVGGGAVGVHVLSADLFFADTSHLSRSVGRGRSRVRRSDAGPSNSGRPSSGSLTLEGAAIPALPGLSYNIGYAYQAAAQDERPEKDYTAGLIHVSRIDEAFALELLAEYAWLDNADGEADRSRRYLTGSVAALYDDLVFAVAYTHRDERVPGDRDNDDYLFQLSAGYFTEIGIGEFGFEVAYLLTREENLKASTVGLRASYVVSF